MILEVNVKQAVSRIEVNPRKKIECPTVGTSEIINALSKSYDFLRDNIINQD